MKYYHLKIIPLVLVFAVGAFMIPHVAVAGSAAEIDREVKVALKHLYAETPSAKGLAKRATGILVFPGIVKGGFIVGGQYGEGALLKNGKTTGYYNTIQASYGLQAGLQKYGYALFFMTDKAMDWLDRSDGWELGTGPSIVVVDEGLAKSFSTTTAKDDIYAFFFHEEGLMGGMGLQGTKVTKINPD